MAFSRSRSISRNESADSTVTRMLSRSLLAGCLGSASTVDYNSAVPVEKTCTLNISATLTVKKFDGQDVKWASGFSNWAAVRIPEGGHTFVLDYQNSMQAGRVYRLNDIEFTYNRFQAGHTYLLAAQFGAPGSQSMPIRLGIKDVTNEPDWDSLSKAFRWTEGFKWLPVTVRKTAE